MFDGWQLLRSTSPSSPPAPHLIKLIRKPSSPSFGMNGKFILQKHCPMHGKPPPLPTPHIQYHKHPSQPPFHTISSPFGTSLGSLSCCTQKASFCESQTFSYPRGAYMVSSFSTCEPNFGPGSSITRQCGYNTWHSIGYLIIM